MNKNNHTFLNCLRAQIFPDEYADERISSIKNFCLKYGFQNVILIFNGEEFHVGHIQKEELKPWIEVMKKAKKAFAEVGISTSLNPWIEFGHLDRGRKLAPNQHFQTMVDRFGKEATLVACPLSPEWKKYYLDLLTYYAKEIEPEVLWIEDDYRFHNHDPLSWGGCFCPLHMKEFARRLGKEETREEFVANISKREPTIERKVWLDSEREILNSLAKEIGETIKKCGIKTHIGLMSSLSFRHSAEARDWKELHNSFAYDGVKIDRLHLPAYREMGAKNFYFDFNRSTIVNRSFLGNDCLMYPELENSEYCLFSKDPKFLVFQVESALPLGLSGMTYNIFESTGNGAQEEFHYGEALKKRMPFIEKVSSLDVKPSEMSGLLFPLDEMTVYNRHREGFLNLETDDYDVVGYFSSAGYSYKVSAEKSFKNETIILTGDNVWNFTEEQLKNLFKDNFIFLDGGAVLVLKERGLLSLIEAGSAENLGDLNAFATMEMSEEGPINGVHNYRECAQRRTGSFVSITYKENKVKIASGLYSPRMHRDGNGLAYNDNFMIYPYVITGVNNSCFFFTLRKALRERHLLPNIQKPFVYSVRDGVYSYLYKKKDSFVLLLTNANYNDFGNISFTYGNFDVNQIILIDEKGNEKEASFKKENNKIVIDEEMKYLSVTALIIK